MNFLILASTIFAVFFTRPATAVDTARILPAGARAVGLRVMHTQVSERWNSNGQREPVASPFALSLTFGDFLALRGDDDDTRLFRGFLLSQGETEEAIFAHAHPRIRSHVTVTAPMFSIGLGEGWMVAAGLPVVSANHALAVDLALTPAYTALVAKLSQPEINQPQERALLENEVQRAESRVLNALALEGYQAALRHKHLDLGDLQVFARKAIYQTQFNTVSLHVGVTAPTGRPKNPDSLLDQGAGDGQWDATFGALWDHSFSHWGVTTNIFAKATAQFPGRRSIRPASVRDAIRVPKVRVTYDPGDIAEAGAGFRWQGPSWLSLGAGLSGAAKGADNFSRGRPGLRATLLSADKPEAVRHTKLRQLEAELEGGISSLDAFFAGRTALPFESRMSFKRALAATGALHTPWLQWETVVFF